MKAVQGSIGAEDIEKNIDSMTNMDRPPPNAGAHNQRERQTNARSEPKRKVQMQRQCPSKETKRQGSAKERERETIGTAKECVKALPRPHQRHGCRVQNEGPPVRKGRPEGVRVAANWSGQLNFFCRATTHVFPNLNNNVRPVRGALLHGVEAVRGGGGRKRLVPSMPNQVYGPL